MRDGLGIGDAHGAVLATEGRVYEFNARSSVQRKGNTMHRKRAQSAAVDRNGTAHQLHAS